MAAGDTLTKPDAVIKLPNPAPTALASFPREALQVWPNPVSDQLYVRLPAEAPLSLYDAHGAHLWEATLSKGVHALPFAQLPVGLYFLRIGPWTVKVHKIG